MLTAVQEDLDDAAASRRQLEVSAGSLQSRAVAAEERVLRLERENKETADRLHRQVCHSSCLNLLSISWNVKSGWRSWRAPLQSLFRGMCTGLSMWHGKLAVGQASLQLAC